MYDRTRIYIFRTPNFNDFNYSNYYNYKNKIITIIIILSILWLLGKIIEGLYSNLLLNIFKFLFFIPLLLFSLSFHEFAHATVADFLGDPTPRKQGRLSLNPLKHLDLIGTIMLIFTNFGWAKPVLVNPNNFRIPQRAMFFVALAGPLSNLFLAIIGALSIKFLSLSINYIYKYYEIKYNLSFIFTFASTILNSFIILNLALAIFNLLPIPPLDGSRILRYFLPYKYNNYMELLDEIGPVALLLAVTFGLINSILHPLVSISYKLIMNIIF